MLKSSHQELPDCCYHPNQPISIFPNAPTPKHSLYLSNLDDQKFLRFSIKYLYLFKKSISVDILKYSLSNVLVEYYPLAGRLRTSEEDDHKLEVDCNGEGAVFAAAFMDMSAEEFLELSRKPNRSWRKLLYGVEANSFLDIPPLVVQVRLISLTFLLFFSQLFFVFYFTLVPLYCTQHFLFSYCISFLT